MNKETVMGLSSNRPGIQSVWHSLSIPGKVSAIILALLVLMAIFAPLVSWLPHERSSGPPLVASGNAASLGDG